MSIRLQHLREAWSYLSSFVGRAGELIVDTTNNRVIVHDGVTAGGWPAAKLSEVLTDPPGNLSALGVGTAADLSNPLTVRGTTSLFDSGTDMRVKINKASMSNTGSFIFQTGFSGRAEIGLLGDDKFHFKVSPDGTSWSDVLVLSVSGSTALAQLGGLTKLATYTVATLPSGNVGAMAFVSNARMYNGTGTLETEGAGTGGLAVHNGTAWKIAGTNQTISA